MAARALLYGTLALTLATAACDSGLMAPEAAADTAVSLSPKLGAVMPMGLANAMSVGIDRVDFKFNNGKLRMDMVVEGFTVRPLSDFQVTVILRNNANREQAIGTTTFDARGRLTEKQEPAPHPQPNTSIMGFRKARLDLDKGRLDVKLATIGFTETLLSDLQATVILRNNGNGEQAVATAPVAGLPEVPIPPI